MRVETGKYMGSGEDMHLEISGQIEYLEVRRMSAESPSIVLKTKADPDGQHTLVQGGSITHYLTGLEFTGTSVHIPDGDEWLNALGEEYRWMALINGGFY